MKFADDTYLIVPASNCESCEEEIKHFDDWANSNNLRLNHVKSMEIVFVPPRCRRAVVIPESAVPTIPRVEEIKALGVTISRKFSVALPVSCAQSLFALRTLRHHGLPTDALHTIFQATVVSKLSYTLSARWGFASAANRNCLEAFLSFSQAVDNSGLSSGHCCRAGHYLFGVR